MRNLLKTSSVLGLLLVVFITGCGSSPTAPQKTQAPPAGNSGTPLGDDGSSQLSIEEKRICSEIVLELEKHNPSEPTEIINFVATKMIEQNSNPSPAVNYEASIDRILLCIDQEN